MPTNGSCSPFSVPPSHFSPHLLEQHQFRILSSPQITQHEICWLQLQILSLRRTQFPNIILNSRAGRAATPSTPSLVFHGPLLVFTNRVFDNLGLPDSWLSCLGTPPPHASVPSTLMCATFPNAQWHSIPNSCVPNVYTSSVFSTSTPIVQLVYFHIHLVSLERSLQTWILAYKSTWHRDGTQKTINKWSVSFSSTQTQHTQMAP